MPEPSATESSIVANARKLLRFLSQQKESLSQVLILTHDYPDPDAMASAFALHYLLEKIYGINSRIVYGGVIGRVENRAMVRTLKIPLHKIKHGEFKKYSQIALVDTQPAFTNNSFPKNRKPTIVIDQHPSIAPLSADLVIVDEECGATTTILAEALLLVGAKIPAFLATAMVYGILTDTLNLYRAKKEEVIRVYLDILPYCDLKILAHIQNPERERRFFSILGLAIHKAMVRRSLIVCHLGAVENPDVVSQIADFFLTYRKMRWSFCTGRYKGKLYASLRMERTGAKASEILRDVFEDRGKAGGHEMIAGGSIKVAGMNEAVWDEAEDYLQKKLMKRLRIGLKGDFYYPFRNPS